MEPDINWRDPMLNHLYKKLHIMFTISIMLIITLIIGILSVNYIKVRK